ncbi:hypothetical protein [Pontibacter sp. G13]|uniref:hypothetical protein n=1 Tax=Pontibacter sp. G13 TaxID=3074898 RepID=UPI00288AA76A|nr:hypothetical protein [Pontibacter sp. G13]WNJ17528.1 hypothetical protein RJD25_21985 [Pontibacter sp. G13]
MKWLSRIEIAHLSEEDRAIYYRRLKYYRDYHNQLEYREKRGIEEGFKIGFERGIQGGFKIGFERGIQEAIRRKMANVIEAGFKEGASLGALQRMTKTPIDQLAKTREKLLHKLAGWSSLIPQND